MSTEGVWMDSAVAPTRPWWLELGGVLPRSVKYAANAVRPQPIDTVPALSPNPLTFATVALDEFAMSAAYLVIRRGLTGNTEFGIDVAEEAVARLEGAGAVADPRLVHPCPPTPTDLRLTRRRRGGIAFEHLSFTSAYCPPVDLPGWEGWCRPERNRTVHAYLVRHGDRPRPWLLVLHGHRMGEPRDLRMLGALRLAQSLGVDVAHLVLPHHGPRGRGGHDTFPGVDPVANLYGMAQSVSDARALLAWMRDQSAGPVGVYGISLGGHVSALLASLDDGLSCVVAGVPVCDLATMLSDTIRGHWGPDLVAANHILDPAPVTLSRLVSPLGFEPALPRENRFLYAAVGDRLVTPQQALALWQHWEQPEILWLQGGHILNNMRASRRFVAHALRTSGVVDRSLT